MDSEESSVCKGIIKLDHQIYGFLSSQLLQSGDEVGTKEVGSHPKETLVVLFNLVLIHLNIKKLSSSVYILFIFFSK